MQHLYTDGSTLGPNPSSLGGAWSFVLVEDDKILHKKSGLIHPADIDLPTVTNNLTELYAAIMGIKSLPKGWNGRIFTDSQVTLWRITSGNSFKGIPDWLEERTRKLRHNRTWTARLLSGHPTKDDLIRGYKKRTGRPVSKWNVHCDAECCRLARQFLEDL